ncbi:MAG: DUF5723 family protein, partial [Bacteroidota bacterium]
MGNVTPQSSMNNASFFPDAEFYFSLPALSGLNLKLDNAFTYNQLMKPVDGTDSVRVDIAGVLDELKEGDNLRLKGDISLFQFGIRAGNKTFTLFYNLRYAGGMRYPVQFLDYFVNGNGNFIGERVEEKKINGGGIAYTELGLGYTHELFILEDKKLRVGGRLKFLQGIAHASTGENASINMYTDPSSYDLSVVFNDATFRTAGLNELEEDNQVNYVIGFGENQNTGFGVDLGAELEIDDRWNGFLSINDLGFINWRQDVESYTFKNSEIRLDGFDDLEDIDLSQALEDSLDMWSERDTTNESFRTPIGTRLMIGATYKVFNSGRVSGTISYSGSSYGQSEIGFGAGYTHQFGKTLTLSTSLVKEQFRPVKLGGGLMLRVGSLQIYGVFDDMLNVVRDPADI